MNKKVTIYNYERRPMEIEIPDFDKVVSIFCEVITGDEILHVYYIDGKEKEFDSCPAGRCLNFHDGEVVIPLDKLDEFSSIHYSYDMLEHFDNLDILNAELDKLLNIKKQSLNRYDN